MLGKLIKYDLKASIRIFLIFHGVFAVTCIMARLIFIDNLDFNSPVGPLATNIAIISSLFILLMSAMSLCTCLLVVLRFYRNLFSREGYLTWTLPASPLQHLWSKIISGYLLLAVDTIIVYLGVFFLVTGQNVQDAYSVIASEVTQELGMPISHFGLLMFAMTIISCINSIIMLYFCVTVGQLFPAHRVIWAFVIYFGISFVLQAITMIFMIICRIFPAYSMDFETVTVADYMTDILILSFVIFTITTVLQYIVTHYIMKNKINLT